MKEEVERTVATMEALVREPVPPTAKKIPFCKRCAYAEFCWS